MCVKCVRYSKRVKPSLSFGKIKVYAHRLMNGQSIPFFANKADNVAIEAHVERILKAKARRGHHEEGSVHLQG